MPALKDPGLRGAPWLVLFALVVGAWIALYAMAIPTDMREASRIFGSEFWSELCRVTPDAAGYGRLVVMWALMSTAMMLPTALPTFAAYMDVGNSATTTRPLALGAGFLAVWWGFSLLAAGLQIALYRAELVSDFGDSRSAALSAALLAGAGAYQFTPMKESCLAKCRSPMGFLMEHWDDGAFSMGVRLGAVCLGCCWALMLLAFVGGVMSLAFMGLATLIMTIEKLPDLGKWISRPLGGTLLLAAVWTAGAGI